MTVHVLHAGDGYLYLIRQVAAHDARLAAGASLAAYYTATGQPPGQWAGTGTRGIGVAGVVTEAQMRSLFGEGLHPDADRIQAQFVENGLSPAEATQATRLGRRFPRYKPARRVTDLARDGYQKKEQELGRPLIDEEKLTARQDAINQVFQRRTGRSAVDPVELGNLGETDQASSRREAVAGYDLAFTPVKSVATLWGLASEPVRQQIFEAHEAAVADSLAWFEQNVAFTRAGAHGQAQVDTQGVIAAQFHHWDSRAGDPDLHTHVAISNKVQGPDGKWRSLDGRTIFAAAVSVSERYNTRIEDELRSRLGVEFAERSTVRADRRPVREIVGLPTDLLNTFSKRRRGIEQQYQDLLAAYRRDHGRDPNPSTRHALYQQATLNERPEKPRGRSLQQMVEGWRAEAEQILGTPAVSKAVENLTLHRAQEHRVLDVAGLADVTVAALTASRATWNEHHLRAEAQRRTRGFATADRDQLVEAVVAAAVDPRRSVRITLPRTLEEPAELRRRNGESVFHEHGSTLYTTHTVLEAERRIADAGRERGAHRLAPAVITAVLTQAAHNGRALNDGQAALVRAFCCSGHRVQLGLAPAGTGKTTAMRGVTDAWRAAGKPVVALAPSAAAAEVLGQELGVAADTLAKFDHDQPAIEQDTLILVDEAGMAGTLILDRLVVRAKTAGAVVRLVGDDQQLAAIEAGGVLRHLEHEVGAIRMHEVLRFTDPAEAEATLKVRRGDATAADHYLAKERVIAGTGATMPDAAYAAWLADIRGGRDALLLASCTSTVDDLNSRARADLVLDGKVAVDGVALHNGTVAGIGDRVATRRNERRNTVNAGKDWVKNGDGWTATAIHDDGSMTVQHRRHRGYTTLPAEYVAQHVELDYARTVRRSQGLTVDHAHLVVDPQMSRPEFYVGVSRARHDTQLYVPLMTDPGPDHRPEMAGSARDVLTQIITRSATQPSAHEAIKTAVDTLGDLRRMSAEYEHALDVRGGDRHRLVAEVAHPGITADRAWPAVARQLHIAEGLGHQPAATIAKADRLGDYTDATSEARVLAYRLNLLNTKQAKAVDTKVPTWLAAAPPTTADSPTDPRWPRYLDARHAEMAERITTLGIEARGERATWLAEIGSSDGRAAAIRNVVAYRAVYDQTGDDALGPQPDRAGRQHEAWTATRRAINRSHADDTAASANPGAPNAVRLLALLNQDEATRGNGDSYGDHPGTSRSGPTRGR